MNTTKIQPLTLEAFQPYGTFATLTPPAGEPLVGNADFAFWPECGGVLNLGHQATNQVAIGVCQVKWREFTIDVSEYHSFTSEGLLPLDGDIYLHVGRPTTDETVPAVEIFHVPQGTMIVLKPGIWHHAPFPTQQGASVNILIVLPQRTFANDSVVREPEAPIRFSV